MGVVPNPIPSEQHINQMFGFVTDEDRQRWQGGLSEAQRERINESRKPIFGPKLAEHGTKLGERLAEEQRQAARIEENRRRGEQEHTTNRKRTTTVVEHIREEPDEGFEFGG